MTGSSHFWRHWLTGTHCVGWALTVGVGSPPTWANTNGPAEIAVNAPLSAPPRIFPTQSVRKDAPNILVIMTDDVGFGASAPFGGPIATPTFAELARSGVRFNNFHTTGLCSPTRAALLTGRNPHEVGFGNVSEMAVGYP